MKYLVIIGDGMSDYPVKRLGGRTPLMAATKPAIDRIAAQGRCGLLVTVEENMPAGSEVANLTVLGYDPEECYEGRGVLEAASQGVALNPHDIALRCNLICVRDGRIKNHSAGHITTEEGRRLIADVDARLGTEIIQFYPGISYRHLLVLSTGSPALECFPPHDNVGRLVTETMIRPRNPEAEATARLLNRLVGNSHEFLRDHPVNVDRRQRGMDDANYIWPWSPGRRPKMKTLKEKYGISGAVISAVDLINGTGIYAGLDVIHVEGATGLWDTNYEGKADAAVDALRDHDFVYCHVEATDEAGHIRDLDLKVKAIEYLDRRLVARILDRLEKDGIEAVVAILPDHPTPVETGNHVREPVPVAVWDPRQPADEVVKYDEEAVKKGSLGVLHGAQFMELLLGDKR